MDANRSLLCSTTFIAEDDTLKCAALCLFAMVVATRIAHGQSGALTGIVVDSSGSPVSGADLTIAGATARTTTDAGGRFRIGGLASGTTVLRARRLGFIPDSIAVSLGARTVTDVTVQLAPLAAALKPVTVRANRRNFTGRLAGYYKRLEQKNNGYFITRGQIDRENPRTLSQLLQHVPGMTTSRGRAGGQGVRMRGRGCWPLVWLDGSPMPSGDVDLDGIPPNTLQGIELYLGSTTAPARYSAARDLSSCGTILLWSRGPDTDPIVPRVGSGNLEALVASHMVYSADQVDSAAQLDTRRSLALAYPAELFAEKLAGSVVAEFVVDAEGRVERETFGVVSSTHRLMVDAVRQSLESARYRPAIKDGRRVRQVVHQPFLFSPP